MGSKPIVFQLNIDPIFMQHLEHKKLQRKFMGLKNNSFSIKYKSYLYATL